LSSPPGSGNDDEWGDWSGRDWSHEELLAPGLQDSQCPQHPARVQRHAHEKPWLQDGGVLVKGDHIHPVLNSSKVTSVNNMFSKYCIVFLLLRKNRVVYKYIKIAHDLEYKI